MSPFPSHVSNTARLLAQRFKKSQEEMKRLYNHEAVVAAMQNPGNIPVCSSLCSACAILVMAAHQSPNRKLTRANSVVEITTGESEMDEIK